MTGVIIIPLILERLLFNSNHGRKCEEGERGDIISQDNCTTDRSDVAADKSRIGLESRPLYFVK